MVRVSRSSSGDEILSRGPISPNIAARSWRVSFVGMVPAPFLFRRPGGTGSLRKIAPSRAPVPKIGGQIGHLKGSWKLQQYRRYEGEAGGIPAFRVSAGA